MEIYPLTPERWDDFAALFGKTGADGGCWCMYWRLPSAEWRMGNSEHNKSLMKELVGAGKVPGLLAYEEGVAVGWCSIAPRVSYDRLVRSKTIKPVDDRPVWSIVCFFIKRGRRGQGIARALLDAAVAYARAHDAPVVEAYPRDPGARIDNAAAYMGTLQMFLDAGFKVVGKTEAKYGAVERPIVRYELK